jgi:glucosylglycerate synthase
MATVNPIPDTSQAAENTAADLLVLVTPMPPEHFKGVLANLGSAFSPGSFVVATQNELPADIPSSVRIAATPQSNAAWSLRPIDFVNAAQYGREHEAKAFLILGPEADSLSPLALSGLADAVLSGSIDLAVPHYSLPSHAGLINSAILYPLTRAAFASRVRFPLSIDLAMSPRMAERLAGVAQQFLRPTRPKLFCGR